MNKLERLRELEKRMTQGEWELWTGCSWRRIGHKNGNKPFIYPFIASDGHPDICGGDDLEKLVELRNACPRLLDALEAAIEGLKEIVIVADMESDIDDNGNPNAAMKALTEAKATLTKIESLLGEQGKE